MKALSQLDVACFDCISRVSGFCSQAKEKTETSMGVVVGMREVGRALQWGGMPRMVNNCEMRTLLVNVLSCLDFLELALEAQCVGSPLSRCKVGRWEAGGFT